MKKIILTIFLLILLTTSSTFAQTDNSEEPNSSLPSSKTLDAIKDKVASRVAELNLVEKRGIIGEVDSVSDTQIILNTLTDKRRIVDVDEFTNFTSSVDGISDIKKGSVISVLGLFNKDSKRLLARFINEISVPLYINGVISNVDEEEFTISISTIKGKNYTVDVERITKTFEFDDNNLKKAGFSDINTSINAVVIGFEDVDEENRITASKIIFFPDGPQNPKIKVDAKLSTSPTATKSSDDN